jgi:hypothetical protein
MLALAESGGGFTSRFDVALQGVGPFTCGESRTR